MTTGGVTLAEARRRVDEVVARWRRESDECVALTGLLAEYDRRGDAAATLTVEVRKIAARLSTGGRVTAARELLWATERLDPGRSFLLLADRSETLAAAQGAEGAAAELRAQADSFEAMADPRDMLPDHYTLAMVAARLRARADELDPPGGAR